MATTVTGSIPSVGNFATSVHGGEITSNLLEKYREVLMSSLITSCGLDALIFRNDDVNGHVDTLHNVSESQKNGGKPIFKKLNMERLMKSAVFMTPRNTTVTNRILTRARSGTNSVIKEN
jgi:hypothetical protein